MFYTAFSATPGVPSPDAVAEYLRCYRHPGAMSSAFARYRGVEREIAHNTARPTLTIPVLAVGGAQVMGAAVADNLENAADDLRGGTAPRRRRPAPRLLRRLIDQPALAQLP